MSPGDRSDELEELRRANAALERRAEAMAASAARLEGLLAEAREERQRLRGDLRASGQTNAELRERLGKLTKWAEGLRDARDAALNERRRLHEQAVRTRTPRGIHRLPDAATAGDEPGALLRLARAPVVVDVEHVSKSFRAPPDPRQARTLFGGRVWGRGPKEMIRALDDVSFQVRRGEFVAVVGANGSGKSTLLKLIAGSYRADAGRIRVAGRLSALIEIGVGFNPELTAYDNVLFNGVLMGLTRAEVDERYEGILEFAGLTEFRSLKLRNYSSGMRVRLGFSTMMQVDGDVFLVDEALAVGDPSFQERCFEMLGQRRREGRTILLVSQSMSQVIQKCDRAVLLDNGALAASGAPEAVAERYAELMKPGRGGIRREGASAAAGEQSA